MERVWIASGSSFQTCSPGQPSGFQCFGGLRKGHGTRTRGGSTTPTHATPALLSGLRAPALVRTERLSAWPGFHRDVPLASVRSVSQVILGQFMTLCGCFCFETFFSLPICSPRNPLQCLCLAMGTMSGFLIWGFLSSPALLHSPLRS